MKKGVIGFVVAGAVVWLRPVARRGGHRLLEHCGEMAERCKRMATEVAGRGEAVSRP